MNKHESIPPKSTSTIDKNEKNATTEAEFKNYGVCNKHLNQQKLKFPATWE